MTRYQVDLTVEIEAVSTDDAWQQADHLCSLLERRGDIEAGNVGAIGELDSPDDDDDEITGWDEG